MAHLLPPNISRRYDAAAFSTLSRSATMKIPQLECLHADGGFRNLDFLKISTDEGLVGWSEYNESFGGMGVTSIIENLARCF